MNERPLHVSICLFAFIQGNREKNTSFGAEQAHLQNPVCCSEAEWLWAQYTAWRLSVLKIGPPQPSSWLTLRAAGRWGCAQLELLPGAQHL